MLKEGMQLIQSKVVNEGETAAKVASGALEVFSTPMLIAFMENTAFNLAQKELAEGDTTVGISVNIKHLKANLIGDKLSCIATLEKIDGKKLDFSVKVLHGETVVGEGEHSRFIVNEKKFLEKLNK
ncbi:thioesterase family protein [uncultured Fusobacterium sp.]|uniref:thioesterase family protein n=1 Tax=uncultured Fusobacterium sp. TaxID=159267 RepID=UPI0025D57F76|nr:thioesterase family protein [uncultured Fusobacterium sp.]